MIDGGGAVRGLNAGAREMPRSALDGLISRAQELGAKGLVWAFREGDGWRSPTAKFLTAEELAALNERLGAEEGDLLLVVADKPKVANAVLGQLRLDLAAEFGLIPEGSDDLLWIVDWPLMEENDGGRLGPAAPSLHRAGRRLRPRRPRRRPGPRLRPGLERPGDGRRLDPHQRRRAAGQGLRRARASTPRRPRRASASCSRRCATAPRRTAASPTASTGSSSASPAPTRSAT